MLHGGTHDWNTMMAQELKNLTAFMGNPETMVRQKEGQVRMDQMSKGGQNNKSRGQNIQTSPC